MLDIEFTIQSNKLWMLQCRVGKRNGIAAVRMASEMKNEGMIDTKEAVSRVTPDQLDELLHPILSPDAERAATLLAKGLPAGPGGATGRVVFTASDAVDWVSRGERVILATFQKFLLHLLISSLQVNFRSKSSIQLRKKDRLQSKQHTILNLHSRHRHYLFF